MDKQLKVHIAKQNMQLDGSLQSKIIATMLGLAGEIEREFIRMRTKEALAARKAAGHQLGRPKGPANPLKLDAKRDQIEKYLGIRATAKLVDAAPSTLSDYVKRRGLQMIYVLQT